MDTARSLAGGGYAVLLVAFAAAAYVGWAGALPAVVPVPAPLEPLVAWAGSVPPAAFLAGLGLVVWGAWRLFVPA